MDENELLKTTALLYFKDALDKQDYESCASLIALAKQYGAVQEEITEVITDNIRTIKKWKPREASRIKAPLLTKENK